MIQAKQPADLTSPILEGKLALLQKLRDELGSSDTIHRLFFGDLEPIALQPGGANAVVHLYKKANGYHNCLLCFLRCISGCPKRTSHRIRVH